MSIARKINSTEGQTPKPASKRAPFGQRHPWALRIAAAAMLIPLTSQLVSGHVISTIAALMALIGFAGAAWATQLGMAYQRLYDSRTIARAPKLPMKLVGMLLAAFATAIVAIFATNYGLIMGLLFGLLMFACCFLAYGLDPIADKGVDPDLEQRAGVSVDKVLGMLNEASAKIDTIEVAASRLHNQEMRERIASIVGKGRQVLNQIEADPRDISRARRFLVTYLDGTKDVITEYGKQQSDLANTQLSDNFRRVLETVDRVFSEQIDHLKKNERLDLDVQIDVLEAQLKHEGVG